MSLGNSFISWFFQTQYLTIIVVIAPIIHENARLFCYLDWSRSALFVSEVAFLFYQMFWNKEWHVLSASKFCVLISAQLRVRIVWRETIGSRGKISVAKFSVSNKNTISISFFQLIAGEQHFWICTLITFHLSWNAYYTLTAQIIPKCMPVESFRCRPFILFFYIYA